MGNDAWFGPGKKGLPPSGKQQEMPRVDLHKLVAEQFVCQTCERPAPIHTWVNGQLWNEIKNPYAGSGEGGVYCLYCMSEKLSAMGYKDGTVGLSISNGPFCNMEWQAITEPLQARIEELEAAVNDSQATLLAIKADCAARIEWEEDQMASHIVDICQQTMLSNRATLSNIGGSNDG